MSKCELITEQPGMKIVVVYIAVSRGQRTLEYAQRFVKTYQEFPPGIEHSLLIVCNGGRLPGHIEPVFKPLNCSFVLRPNDGGKDISAYQDVADKTTSDFMVCLGESNYFHQAGWLARLAEARIQLGPGMYGVFSTNNVRTHLHTTAFGIDPKFLTIYPPVTTNAERYQFEHGPGCLWHRIGIMGGRAWLVTWDGIWEPHEWRFPRNIIWRDDQSNCLWYCNHSERHQNANALNKYTWQRNADAPFRL